VIEVADGAGVSKPTAHAAFVAYAETVLGNPAPVRVLGIDETRRGKPRWTRDNSESCWARGRGSHCLRQALGKAMNCMTES